MVRGPRRSSTTVSPVALSPFVPSTQPAGDRSTCAEPPAFRKQTRAGSLTQRASTIAGLPSPTRFGAVNKGGCNWARMSWIGQSRFILACHRVAQEPPSAQHRWGTASVTAGREAQALDAAQSAAGSARTAEKLAKGRPATRTTKATTTTTKTTTTTTTAQRTRQQGKQEDDRRTRRAG